MTVSLSFISICYPDAGFPIVTTLKYSYMSAPVCTFHQTVGPALFLHLNTHQKMLNLCFELIFQQKSGVDVEPKMSLAERMKILKEKEEQWKSKGKGAANDSIQFTVAGRMAKKGEFTLCTSVGLNKLIVSHWHVSSTPPHGGRKALFDYTKHISLNRRFPNRRLNALVVNEIQISL